MKNVGLLLFFGLIAALFGGWFLWQEGHQSAPSPLVVESTSVLFTELASGTNADVTTRESYLITNDEELRDLWKLLRTDSERPTIDFTKDSVLAVFAGEEPTAGYTIAVRAITETNERMINIEIGAPGVTCGAAEVVTTPYQIIKVAKTDLPLAHKDAMVTTGCLQ